MTLCPSETCTVHVASISIPTLFYSSSGVGCFAEFDVFAQFIKRFAKLDVFAQFIE